MLPMVFNELLKTLIKHLVDTHRYESWNGLVSVLLDDIIHTINSTKIGWICFQVELMQISRILAGSLTPRGERVRPYNIVYSTKSTAFLTRPTIESGANNN